MQPDQKKSQEIRKDSEREGESCISIVCHCTQVHQPVLYSHYDSCSLNQRAAWLAGGPVYGNALVAAVKLRPNEWRTPCMVWDSYNLPMFRGLLGQTLPSSLYAISCAMPLLATLPRTYRYLCTHLCSLKELQDGVICLAS